MTLKISVNSVSIKGAFITSEALLPVIFEIKAK